MTVALSYKQDGMVEEAANDEFRTEMWENKREIELQNDFFKESKFLNNAIDHDEYMYNSINLHHEKDTITDHKSDNNNWGDAKEFGDKNEDFDSTKLKVDPNHPNSIEGLENMDMIAFNIEYANQKVLEKLLHWSYDQVLHEKDRLDGILRAEDIPSLLHRTLNPSSHEIDKSEQELLSKAANELRHTQGLHDDNIAIYKGFITRGMPIRTIKKLAKDMHTRRHGQT